MEDKTKTSNYIETSTTPNHKLNAYDEICTATFINLYSIGIRSNSILNFKNLNLKNDSHKFIFEIAKSVAALYDMRIHLNYNFFKRLKIYFPIRKSQLWFKKYTKKLSELDVEDLIKHQQGYALALTGEENCLEKIYKTYFESED